MDEYSEKSRKDIMGDILYSNEHVKFNYTILSLVIKLKSNMGY